MANELAVEMLGITKIFPGVIANEDVTLEISKSEIHGLIGENGAGKSTLMKILYGLYQPEAGQIRIDGKHVVIRNPQDAIKLGIGMVHQHFMLAPSLTVLDNIILGKTPTKGGLINYKEARRQIEELLSNYGFVIDLDARVYQISVGQMQRVEIIKALYRGARILVLDEPTAVLTPVEIDDLFNICRNLKQKGCSIVIITHKLKEVMAVTDTITVMRNGRVTGNVRTSDTDERNLASLMVGREVIFQVEKTEAEPKDVVLEVEKIVAKNDRGLQSLKAVSLEVRSGEIVGIAGVEGNGQSELIEVITGMRSPQTGKVCLLGRDITHLPIKTRRDLGLSHIPEDRLVVGVSKDCSIEENLIVNNYYSSKLSNHSFLRQKSIEEFSWDLIKKFDIKVSRATDPISSLSGGNMQKVVIAREIDVNPFFLVAGQPTRGVDVGAIEYIHKQLIVKRDAGAGILLVSSEIDEILSLSDRIYVLYEGEIVGNFANENINEVELGLFMTGSKRQYK